MKRKIGIVILVVLLAMALLACDVATTDKENTATDDGYVPGEYAMELGGGTAVPDGDIGKVLRPESYSISGKSKTLDGAAPRGDDGSNGYETPTPRAGLLTACAYDDHEYFAYWQGLVGSTQEGAGKFAEYFESMGFKALRQIEVTVGEIAGAQVALYRGETLLGKAVSNNAGKAYVYAPTKGADLQVKVTVAKEDGTLTLEKAVEGDKVTFDETELAEAKANSYGRIEIMFVIDTTGSMGDEIDYLKSEIDDVIGRIKSTTEAEVMLALLFYRDQGDEYVTRYSAFTTDVAAQQEYLAQQDAEGGGDTPEAVEVALSEAVEKQWSPNATKILVHVADAPSHTPYDRYSDRGDDVNTWIAAVGKAAEKGIRIVSVASSGIDTMTEYLFRSQSLVTGGVYVYLTDDSGIGGQHLEATVETRPQVEPLNDCLVRVVAALHQGTEPITVMPEETPAEEQAPQE